MGPWETDSDPRQRKRREGRGWVRSGAKLALGVSDLAGGWMGERFPEEGGPRGKVGNSTGLREGGSRRLAGKRLVEICDKGELVAPAPRGPLSPTLVLPHLPN